MATLGKQRSPVGVAFLSFLTLGLYFIYWHYKVNQEIASYEMRIVASPSVSAVAVSLGWILLFIPSFVSVYNTAERAELLFDYNEPSVYASGAFATFLHALPLLGFPMLTPFYPAYLQGRLNHFWRLEAAKLGLIIEEERRAA